MTLSRAVAVDGYVDELDRFADLVRSLDDSDWRTPSRCEGWSVGDVAAHVSGTVADLAAGRFEGLGTPEVTQREVTERRGYSPAEMADEIATGRTAMGELAAVFDDDAWNGPAPGGIPGTLGEGVEALLFDTYVHAEDIRAATGRPSERGIGIDASISHIATILERDGWGPATLALDGYDEVQVGGNGGQRVTGDPLVFTLAATGRADPAPLGLDPSVNIYK